MKVGKQYIGISNGNKDIIFTVTKVSEKSVNVEYKKEISEGYFLIRKGNITKNHLNKHMRDLTPNSINFITEEE